MTSPLSSGSDHHPGAAAQPTSASSPPAQLPQALTHSLEEHERQDSQQQEQELVHLSLGWRGDAEVAAAGAQSAQEGWGQTALVCNEGRPKNLA